MPVKADTHRPSVGAPDGARWRILDFLLAHVGETVTNEQIQAHLDATGGSIDRWHQRLSELRTDYGWTILSHRDRDDLGRGEYRLESKVPCRDARKREPIPAAVRAEVIARDKSCQAGGCRLRDGDTDPETGGIVRLVPDHVVPASDGGRSTAENLRAMCARHNTARSNLYTGGKGRKDKPNLAALMRAASRDEKRKVYASLYAHFDGKHPDEL